MRGLRDRRPKNGSGALAQDDTIAYRITETLYAAWTGADRPAELHIYRRGGHGFGMAKRGMPSDGWIERFGEWLADLGVRVAITAPHIYI